MGLFGQKRKLTDAERRWNKMWELWIQGMVISPYLELMNYQSEVNNGGHSQYFFNTANCGDVAAEVAVLLSVLPEPLLSNLRRAYDSFVSQTDVDDEDEQLLEECDDVFYAQEAMLNALLENYAHTMELDT